MGKEIDVKEAWIKVLTGCIETVGQERGWKPTELFENFPDLTTRINLAADGYVPHGTPADYAQGLDMTPERLAEHLTKTLRHIMPVAHNA